MGDDAVLIGGDENGRVVHLAATPPYLKIPGQCPPDCDRNGWPLDKYPILIYRRLDYLGHPSRDDQGRVRYQYAG